MPPAKYEALAWSLCVSMTSPMLNKPRSSLRTTLIEHDSRPQRSGSPTMEASGVSEDDRFVLKVFFLSDGSQKRQSKPDTTSSMSRAPPPIKKSRALSRLTTALYGIGSKPKRWKVYESADENPPLGCHTVSG